MIDTVPEELAPMFTRNKDGSISIRDLVSKQKANNDSIPDFILMTPFYKKGLDYLQRYSAKTTINVLFGRHYQAQDLGLDDNFETLMRTSDLYIPERVMWRKARVELLNEIAQKSKPLNSTELRAALKILHLRTEDEEHTFTARTLKAIQASHKTVRFMDLYFDDLDFIPSIEDFVLARNEHYKKAISKAMKNFFGISSTFITANG